MFVIVLSIIFLLLITFMIFSVIKLNKFEKYQEDIEQEEFIREINLKKSSK